MSPQDIPTPPQKSRTHKGRFVRQISVKPLPWARIRRIAHIDGRSSSEFILRAVMIFVKEVEDALDLPPIDNELDQIDPGPPLFAPADDGAAEDEE